MRRNSSLSITDVILSAAKDLLFLRAAGCFVLTSSHANQERIYYTYITASASRTLYVGVTNNLECRIQEHKSGAYGSFTARYRCHRLVWFERYSWIGQAIAREKEVKGWLRARKIALIEQSNPTWVDLSKEWGTKIIYREGDVKADPSLRSG